MLKDIWRREKLMERLFVYHNNICTVQCCVVIPYDCIFGEADS